MDKQDPSEIKVPRGILHLQHLNALQHVRSLSSRSGKAIEEASDDISIVRECQGQG